MKEKSHEVLNALSEWALYVTNKKDLATPEELAALPKVAEVVIEEYKQSSTVAGITSEDNRKVLEATKFVSSDQLKELSNTQIAFLLYFLVANGTDKRFEDFYDIGNQFGVIAANLKY